MATIRKRGRTWTAEVRRRGVSKTATFPTLAEARAWATATEARILAERRGEVPDRPLRHLLERYAAEVTTHRRSARWEIVRINALSRDPIADVSLRDLDGRHVAEWRDRRLAQVSAASVRREWTLLSSACQRAVREWKWLRENPFRGTATRPPSPPNRTRTATDDELARMYVALRYDPQAETVTTISARVGAAARFAVETAMRAGEIAALTTADVDLDRRVARVIEGKTRAASRQVPLSSTAVAVLRQLTPTEDGRLFGITSAQIDALWRKARAKADVDGLRFHDLRHTAITRLARVLDVLSLARVVGHADVRMLMTYYHPSAEDLAQRLA